MRCFRTSNEALYESIRSQLDAAWGLPNDRGTVTCIPPASELPRDSQGRLMLVIDDEFATWPPADTVLPQLIQAGQVEEITREQYLAALPVIR